MYNYKNKLLEKHIISSSDIKKDVYLCYGIIYYNTIIYVGKTSDNVFARVFRSLKSPKINNKLFETFLSHKINFKKLSIIVFQKYLSSSKAKTLEIKLIGEISGATKSNIENMLLNQHHISNKLKLTDINKEYIEKLEKLK